LFLSREGEENKAERGMKKGRCFFHRLSREKAWKVERPKRARVPAWVKNSGSAKGYGFQGGIKPLKHGIKAGEVFI
jgi:hypothetical protein